MPFISAVGFTRIKPSSLLSNVPGTTRAESVSEVNRAAGSRVDDSALGRISRRMRERASEVHCLDLERMSRRRATVMELQGILTDLKDKVAHRIAERTQVGCADVGVGFCYKAS
jgi:hypothetical protein